MGTNSGPPRENLLVPPRTPVRCLTIPRWPLISGPVSLELTVCAEGGRGEGVRVKTLDVYQPSVYHTIRLKRAHQPRVTVRAWVRVEREGSAVEKRHPIEDESDPHI